MRIPVSTSPGPDLRRPRRSRPRNDADKTLKRSVRTYHREKKEQKRWFWQLEAEAFRCREHCTKRHSLRTKGDVKRRRRDEYAQKPSPLLAVDETVSLCFLLRRNDR